MRRSQKEKVVEVDQGGTARVKKRASLSAEVVRYPISSTRVGKKSAVVYLTPRVKRKLKELALDRDLSIQDLMEEAVLELLEKHGKIPNL